MWGHGGLYADWARFLEAWGRGECGMEAAPAALAPEDFAPETWSRLAGRFHAALDERLTRWDKALAAGFRDARGEFELGRALTQSRHGLSAIRALGQHEAVPTDLRGRLLETIDRQVTTAQADLERSAERRRAAGDHRGGEALLRVVRDNPLTAVLRAPAAAPDPWSSAGPPRRREVLAPAPCPEGGAPHHDGALPLAGAAHPHDDGASDRPRRRVLFG